MAKKEKKKGRDVAERLPWKIKMEWCPANPDAMRFRCILDRADKKGHVLGVGPTHDAALADAVERALAMGA